jgi:hypothetical protein
MHVPVERKRRSAWESVSMPQHPIRVGARSLIYMRLTEVATIAGPCAPTATPTPAACLGDILRLLLSDSLLDPKTRARTAVGPRRSLVPS